MYYRQSFELQSSVLAAHLTVILVLSVAYPHANRAVPVWACITFYPIYWSTLLCILVRWRLNGIA